MGEERPRDLALLYETFPPFHTASEPAARPPLTFQCHSSVLGKLIGVKEHSGPAVQSVLNIKHILILEAFVVKVEIPRNKTIQVQNLQDAAVFFKEKRTAMSAPLSSFVRAAVFWVVVDFGESLVELCTDGALVQKWHGDLVLFFNKGLEHKKTS